MEQWLYEQSKNTPKPALYFNAWVMLVKEKYTPSKNYKFARQSIITSFRNGTDLDAKHLLTATEYRSIPIRYKDRWSELGQSNIVWGDQQEQLLERVRAWLNDPNRPQKFILFGWAGTGKTLLAKEIATWQNTIACAFTGKAALELIKQGLDAYTVHSLIYVAQRDDSTGEMAYSLRDTLPILPDLIILDECGMIDQDMDSDLTSFGIPMLVLGDPDQLEPVFGVPAYSSNTDPDFQLTEIHRQALDNPIIWLSREVREGRQLKVGKYKESRVVTQAGAQKRLDRLILDHQQDSKCIVGRNLTRIHYNQRARELLGFGGNIPNEGETLICLKNDRTNGLINGQLWEVIEANEPHTHYCMYHVMVMGERVYKRSLWNQGEPGTAGEQVTVEAVELLLKSQDDVTICRVNCPTAFFVGKADELHWKQKASLSEFDYGYCLTGHKAQGSTFLNVFVLDESYVFANPRKWQYSTITRASNNLIFAI